MQFMRHAGGLNFEIQSDFDSNVLDKSENKDNIIILPDFIGVT